MKVSTLNFHQLCKHTPLKQREYVKCSFKGVEKLKTDAVLFGEKNIYEQALSKLKEINIAEYNSLTQNEREILRQKAQEEICLEKIPSLTIEEIVKIHDSSACMIKNNLDEKYGENNYIVIPIGRSLSSIGKALELKIGKDNVKNIPMSNIYRFHNNCEPLQEETVQKFLNLEGSAAYKEYLTSIGLDKKNVENSGKQYIILDFSSSGTSIEGSKMLLSSNEFLGNKKENIHALAFNKMIKNPTEEDFKVITKKVFEKHSNVINYKLCLTKLLSEFSFKPFAFVGKANNQYTNISKAKDYKTYYSEEKINIRKLFGFCLLDNEFGK